MKVRITPLGGFYIIIMLMFGFAAINTSNNLLYLITSFMMGFMIISGIISYYNIKYIDITFLRANDFFANEENSIFLSLKSKKLIPSFLLSVFTLKAIKPEKSSFINRLLKKDSTAFELLREKNIFLLKPNEEKIIEITHTFEKRGHYKEFEVYLASDFPFGFAYREIKFLLESDTYVYPNPKYCKSNNLNYASDSGKIKIKNNEELYQIKEYKNESLRFINWKASAKLRKLMVNEYADFINEEIVLKPEDFDMEIEQKLSCMSYIVLEAIKNNTKIGLDWNGFIIPPDNAPFHHIKILRFLASV